MKKGYGKKWMAAVLSVSVAASAATLLTGCGKNEDGTGPVGHMQMSAPYSVQEQTSVTKNTKFFDINDFLNTVSDNKLYTVACNAEGTSDNPDSILYLKVESPVEAAGFTFTKLEDEERKASGNTVQSTWQITKDGENYAKCIVSSNWDYRFMGNYHLKAEIDSDTISGKFRSEKSVKSSNIKDINAELPPVMTAEECKQRVGEVEALFASNINKKKYQDRDLSLEGIYYYKGSPGEECIRALYSFGFYSTADAKQYVYLEGTYPIADGDSVQVLHWEQKETKEPGSYGNWIQLK